MSTTIDERVLEMRFDNRHFESNVSNTMSTLEKLKSKLNLTGASKGLENINAAAKNVNMSGLGNAVETVSAKFSALQVMGVTALANITNSAVNAGKRIVSALTIDPVKSGLQEYETKMGSIQTILANTQHQGTTMDDVTEALQKLNLYADKTIYNFQEMTRNIGTFTAAGIDLETSVSSIQGIANLAAVSGSTSQQASTAMYQLSQALAAGKVKLMDWNSVVNAGMGGKVFQNALMETARVMKKTTQSYTYDVDALIKKNGSFRDSLQEGWLTADVLTQTLQQFTMAAKEGSEEWEAYKKSLMETGYTEAQAEEILKMANTATDAATKVKTFTQLFDTLKETAQSGWAQTWELIFGDFEEAKEFFSGLSSMIGGLIDSMSNYRNKLLGGALDSNWDKLVVKINEAGIETGEYEQAVREVWKAHGKSEEDLDALISKYGSLGKAIKAGKISTSILKEALGSLGLGANASGKKIAGFVEGLKKIDRTLTYGSVGGDVKSLQTALEELNHSVGQCGIDGIIGPDTTAAIKEFQEQVGLTVNGIAGPETIAALEKAGTTYAKATNGADEALDSYSELVDNITRKGGRELFLEGFSNVINGLVGTFRALGSAWADIFPASDAQRGLFNAVSGFKKLTEALVLFEEVTDDNGETIIKFNEKGEKLVRIFKGILAVVDIVTTLIGGGFKIAFKVASQFLSYFNLDILDVAAGIGDVLVGVRDLIDGILNIGGVIEKIAPYIEDAAKAVQEWFKNLKLSENLPADIISGLVNGLIGGVGMVWDAAIALAKSIVDAVKSFLGIHSPSVVMAEVGEDTAAGLTVGLESGATAIYNAIKAIVEKIVSAFQKIWIFLTSDRESIDWNTFFGTGLLGDIAKGLATLVEKIIGIFKSFWSFITDERGDIEWGKLFSAGILLGMVWFMKQIATAVSGIAEAFDGLGDVLEGAANVMKSFSKVLNGYAWDLKAQALQKMAIAIGILVLAIVVLSEIDDIGRLWNAVGIIAALALILVGLAIAMDKLNSAAVKVDKDGAKIDGIKSGLLQIGIVIALLAATVKIIGEMDPAKAQQGFKGLLAMAVGLVAFMGIMTLLSRYMGDVSKIGGMMLKLSVAMILMVGVIKLVSGLTATEMIEGIVFATAFALFVSALVHTSKNYTKDVGKIGGMMIALTIAMGLMVGVVKLAAGLSASEMLKGAVFVAGFLLFVKGLIKAVRISGSILGIGGMIMSVSLSLMLMVGVCKLAAMLSYEEMLKGALFVAGFTVFLKYLVSILKVGSEAQLMKVGGTILAMAVAIGILAAVSVALSFVDLADLAKGVAAVSILGLIMATMVNALKGAQNVMGSLIVLTVAIGMMAAAIVALTFIDDTSKLAAATAALAIVMGMFALIEKNAQQINKAVPGIIIMTTAVAALASIIYLLASSLTDVDAAVKSATAIGILMASLAVSMKIASGAGKINLGSILTMVAALALVALIAYGLDALDVSMSLETALSLSTLLLAFAGVTAILSLVGAGAPAALAGAGAFVGVVAIVGAAMAALGALNEYIPGLEGFLDTGMVLLEKIGSGIGKFIGGLIGGLGEGLMDSLSSMMDTFGEIVDKLATISEKSSGIKTAGFDSIRDLIEILGDIGGLTVGSTFSDIFTSGGTSMDRFQTDGKAFFEAMKVIGETASGVQIDGQTIDEIITAAEKLAALQSSLEPINGLVSYLIGHSDLQSFGDVASSFITSMKTALESLWGVQVNKQTFDEIIGAAEKLSELQGSLEPINGLVSYLKGHSDLATFGTTVASFIESMKTALESLWGVQVNTQTFDQVMDAAHRLSELQSSLEPINGLVQFLEGHTDLQTFGNTVASFIESMKTALESLWGVQVNTQTFDEVINAATKLSELQSSLNPIMGLVDCLNGFTDLGTFGGTVATFMTSMKTAVASVDGVQVNTKAFDDTITAAEKLASFQSSLEPMGGVISWFTGRDDLGTFGTNVGLFADAMGKLKTAVGDNGITEAAITSVTNAGNAIIALQDVLPEETWFDGKMDLSDFSNHISNFGDAMKTFSTTAAEINTSAIGTAMTAAYNIKYLIDSLVGIDTSGLQTFTGLGTGGIGADGAAYDVAKAMVKFSNKVAEIDTAAVSTSVSAAIKLRDLLNNLAGVDPEVSANFKVVDIGKEISKYSNKVADIDTSVVSQSITAATRLKNFISSLGGLDPSGISNFKVTSVGTSIKAYATSVTGINFNAATQSISLGTRLKNFITSLSGIDTSGVGSFKTAISELGTVNIAAIAKSFSGASSKLVTSGAEMMNGLINGMRSRLSSVIETVNSLVAAMGSGITSNIATFETAGSAMMMKLASGISSKKNTPKSAFTSAISTAVTAVRSKYTSFYNAGGYLVEGFAAGITAKTWLAKARAKAMAEAAEKAAREALDINSPSRVFREIGMGVPEGFAQGVEKYSNLIDKPVAEMADSAVDSVGNTISKIASVINSDIDAQPTIRPVLDLSDVRAGAASIGGLFDTNSTVGVMANVGTVSSMMSRYRQNGSNEDVVTAIDKLRKDLSDRTGDTYSISGITYDDGSNIATAIKEITRAAIRERRV